MPKSPQYVPTHRAPGKHKAARVPRRALRTTVALTGLAAAVTGVSVAGGLSSGDTTLTRSESSQIAALVTEMLEDVTV